MIYMSNKNPSPLVLFIFTKVLILWSNSSCSIYVSSVSKSSWFHSRLSGTTLAYPSLCHHLLSSSLPHQPPPIRRTGSPFLQRGNPFHILSSILFSLNLPLKRDLILLLLCSETFTSFSLSQDKVKTLDPVRKALPQPSCSALSLQFHVVLREHSATFRLASWPFITGPGSYFPPSFCSSSLSKSCSSLQGQLKSPPPQSLSLEPGEWLPLPHHLGSPGALSGIASSSPWTVTGVCSYLIVRLKLLGTIILSSAFGVAPPLPPWCPVYRP